MRIVLRRLRKLLRAHRSGEAGRLELGWGDSQRLKLDLRGPYLVGVEGRPLLRGLPGAELACSGELSVDMLMATKAGLRPYLVAEHAQQSLTELLGEVLTAPLELSWKPPKAGPPGHPLGLPVSLFALLSDALPLARPPEAVAHQFHHLLDRELLVSREAGPYRLDPIAERTLGQAWRKPVLRQLIEHSGRLEQARTREAWRAFDLLFQLGLVKVQGVEELPRVPVTRDPHWLMPIDHGEPEPAYDPDNTDDLNAATLDQEIPDEMELLPFSMAARRRPS